MVAEAGQPVLFAEMAQYAAGISLSRNTIDLFLALAEEEANPVPVDELVRGRVATSVRRYEPVGVVAAITPYNGAIIMAFQKLIPALMAGNSVILRPSPLTPLSSLAFGSRRRGVLACPPGYSAWSSSRVPLAPSSSRRTLASTWSRSPAPPQWDGRSSPKPRRP